MVSASLIDEPDVMAGLDAWRAYLERLRALPDDDVTKPISITAAEQQIRALEAEAQSTPGEPAAAE